MVTKLKGLHCPNCAANVERDKFKSKLASIGFSSALLALALLYGPALSKTFPPAEILIFLAAYILAGKDVMLDALRNSVRGQVFDENFLMTIAGFGAFAIGQFPEAVGVMLFYSVGEYLQALAVDRSRRSISALMDIRPDYANLKIDGGIRRVSPESVEVGRVIVVKPGEKVPLDGEVLSGNSFVDTSALTGESLPRKVSPGDKVMAGMVNTGGLLEVKVEKVFSESSVSKILDLVQNAAGRKARTEQFITKFARFYTPAVVSAAAAVAVIPPLAIPGAAFSDWIYRALTLLVISCPCALVISIPLGYFGGIGGSSRRGILIKGANFLEALTDIDTVVFDKTGTLTKGAFKVSEVKGHNGFSGEDVLRWAAGAEAFSAHPIAKSIREAYGQSIDAGAIGEYEEVAGYGVKATVGGRLVLAGSEKLLSRFGIDCPVDSNGETAVHVAVDGIYAGSIIVSDEIRADAPRAVEELKALGIKKVVMLTGDDEKAAARVAKATGIDEYFANLLPQDKVARLEQLRAEGGARRRVVFVGDGINDAPVIAGADVGMAMGGLGSDAAIEAADVVIMEDMPSKVVEAVKVARRTRKIVVENIILALGIKGLFLTLGVFGVATMWEAVFADVGVALLAVLNSARTLLAVRSAR
ncbi:heavy metal translocating P-type ATPase [Thermoanaerobacterium sp. DL9XJH110]|uniref:heavy metal translocating P-type ATPase n=1 Tax=Thermoanaerobacterium sp. DL9XJH110 TaxID=3386643 RepID=UPI003BB5E38F